MLPTKGYFQDIECPYYNNSCGRPYCHFRHRKKTAEIVEGEPEKDEVPAIPTYKPTPKSELANIHNKSHIPISYVPDLAFRPDRKSRLPPKFDKPTYKPTPLSILSSANKRGGSISGENEEHTEAIKEIKQNIANVEYNPAISLQPTVDIDFEDLSTEFDLIDEIINSSDKVQKNNDIGENVNNIVHEENTEVLDEVNKQINNLELVNETAKEQPSHAVAEQTHEEKKSKNVKISPEKTSEQFERTSEDKKSKHFKLNSEKTSEQSEQIREEKKSKYIKVYSEKTSEPSEKHSQKKEKYRDKHSEKVSDRPEKSSDKKEKSSEKHSKSEKSSEKSKQSKHEKSSSKPEKTEKAKNSKDRTEKRRSSEKDRSSDKEKSSSSKEKNSKEISAKSISHKSHKSTSRDKHRKEEKKDRKEEKHSSNKKSKHKSKDRSRSRSKERKKSRNREKEKYCDKDKGSKSKPRHKDKHSDNEKYQAKKYKIPSTKKDNDRKMSTEESSSDSDESAPMLTENIESNFSDIDFDDEDETMLECYKIFNEYKPPQKSVLSEAKTSPTEEDYSANTKEDEGETLFGRKRVAHLNAENTLTYSKLHPPSKPKIVNSPGQALANRYKIAKLAQASKEQEFIINEIKQPTLPAKRPAPTLLEAARERKLRREHLQPKPIKEDLVDSIIKGTTKPNATPSVLQTKITVRKIAPAQNVGLIAKAKERISKIQQAQVKTVAQIQKGGRVAHVPETSLSDIPDVLHADKSKLPVNVRTRFLTMIADECVKLYISKEEAFARALNEEFACYEKCKVLATYRNSAMLAVNRLRKEAQERQKLGLGLINVGEDAGKDPAVDFKGKKFYNNIKRWILTEEELDIHGYPREDKEHHGRAVIKNQRNLGLTNLDENQRICSRCHKIYQVDDDGWPLFEEECLYHPMKKRTIRGEQTYLCCRSNDSTGCATSDTHVCDNVNDSELEGYQTTMEPESEDDPRSYAVYALDCEMCYTTKGLELTRVSIVDTECKTIYESLVKPLNPIIDYNTRFSGITKEQMDRTSTSILQIQANILHLCNSKTILMGHSLESDMKALKIVHGTVIDTSVLFPHKMGLPHKRALKALASEYLRKIIQNDLSGHDSAEDAVTCMELIKWKLKDELKLRGSK